MYLTYVQRHDALARGLLAVAELHSTVQLDERIEARCPFEGKEPSVVFNTIENRSGVPCVPTERRTHVKRTRLSGP